MRKALPEGAGKGFKEKVPSKLDLKQQVGL